MKYLFRIFLFSSFILNSCQTTYTGKKDSNKFSKIEIPAETTPVHIRESISNTDNSQAVGQTQIIPKVSDTPSKDSSNVSTSNPVQPDIEMKVKKVAIIVGPGDAKSFGAIAVFSAFQEERIPVSFVSGLGWGALVGGLYARRGSASDLEWQAQRINENNFQNRGLIDGVFGSSRTQPMDSEKSFGLFHDIFGDQVLESFKVPFVCPSYHLLQSKLFFMNRGAADQALLSCISYPPLLSPYKDFIASPRELKLTADHLRRLGAEIVIYVHPLQNHFVENFSLTDKILWSEIGFSLNFQFASVDEVIALPLEKYSMFDFNRKKEMVMNLKFLVSDRVKTIKKKWRL